jgi:hypothetical protein
VKAPSHGLRRRTAFSKLISSDLARWSKLIKDTHIKVE